MHRDSTELDFSAVKVVVGGGAAVQQPVAERWKQVTGSYITEAYGLTETSPGATANPLGAPWNGTIGLPFPSTELSIRDDDFNELPVWTGEGDIDKHTGEICVRGPQVMKGYWNNPEETAKVHAGRLAQDRRRRPHGRAGLRHDHRPQEGHDPGVRLQGLSERGRGRARDACRACSNAAAVGIPDARTGEAVKVVIVRKDPALSAEAVIEHCRAQLTGYKVPRHVEFRDSLPKSPIGKVLRRELREPQKA